MPYGMKLDRAFYTPTADQYPDLEERRDDQSSAVAYCFTGAHGQPVAKCFSGKRAKPDEYVRYSSIERRDAAVAAHFAAVRRREAYAVERRQSIKNARAADKSLTVPADGWMSAPAVAAFLRQCLKEAFPGVNFSVTSYRSLRVRWTDGPSRDQVDRIAKTFAGSYFDGMIDYEGSIYHAIDGQKVRFGASYVFTERDMSADALRIGAEALRGEYPKTNQAPASIEEQEGGWVKVTANPDFPGACADRAYDVELISPEDEHGLKRFVRPSFALELWFNQARPFAVQPSATFDRVAVLGSDGYGNTALPAADGGETGRGYPRPKEPEEATALRAAIAEAEQQTRDLFESFQLCGKEAPPIAPEPVEPRAKRVDCEVIDFAPHLARYIERAEKARRVN